MLLYIHNTPGRLFQIPQFENFFEAQPLSLIHILCVIGSELKEYQLEKLFLLA